MHGLVNYIDTKATCRHLEKRPVKELCGICLYVWGPEPPPPPTHCILVLFLYTVYLFTQGREEVLRIGSVEPERRSTAVHKLGRKYQHDRLYLQSINSDKQLPQSPYTRSIFRWRHFALPSMSLIFLRSDGSILMPPLERLILKTGALNVSMKPFLQRFRKMLTKIWEYVLFCAYRQDVTYNCFNGIYCRAKIH